MLSGLFGSRLREKILLFVWKAGDTYAYEFVKCFDSNVNAVQRQLRILEGLDVFISFVHRGKRFYDFNPRYYLLEELQALLERHYRSLPHIEQRKYTATTAMGCRRASVLS